ncbi:MAG: acyl-CoA dehydratase activase, partial [Pseudomonadota bacterium]
CSVFAKTDMIHLQQIGAPVPDILAGLCFAMVRNFKAQVGKGRHLPRPISFQGGVAANKAIRRAVLEVMELKESELIIPEHFAVLGAVGAALVAKERGIKSGLPADTLQRLRDYIARREYQFVSLPQLIGDNYPIITEAAEVDIKAKTEAYVGVDIGSISTNVVVIDRQNHILYRCYIMTASRPIEAVRAGLYAAGQALGDKIIVRGTGSTGSGRYMTGEFFGADVIRNEISSHARAAVFLVPDVDTIFEIGGQDAKYISLQDGTIVDFAMNKVCAAGTGSFLEEQAEKLGIKIDQEFGNLALASKRPIDLGERCTVFMESQLNYHKLKGAPKEDLVSGLAYSVVKNYMTKVVEDRRIGNHILFQGGVAFNRGAKAAFEAITGKKITVPPHHDILGAVGVAMFAREDMDRAGGQTRFRGFDLRDRKYQLSSFECKKCSNHCEVHKVVFGRESPLFYGARCDIYDSAAKKKHDASSLIPHLFDERERMLMKAYPKDAPDRPNGKKIGIARSLFFHELFPLWKGFFTELGYEVVVSDPTSRDTVRSGAENVIEEPCLPIKLAHGHLLNLLGKNADIIFMPVQSTMEKLSPDFAKAWNCPLTQSVPFIVNSSARISEGLSGKDGKPVVLRPVIHADRGRPWLRKVLRKIARQLGVSDGAIIEKATKAGFQALDSFDLWQQQRGQEVLASLKPTDKAIVIVGRAYNTCDPGITLNLPRKLRD